MATQFVVGLAKPARLSFTRRLLCGHFFLRAGDEGLKDPGLVLESFQMNFFTASFALLRLLGPASVEVRDIVAARSN